MARQTDKDGFLPKIIIFILFFVSLLLIIPVSQIPAQPSITSDGTMGTSVQVNGTDYTISQGTIAGNNQFHSFGLFSINTGESANFTGPASIENIIGRVTGGVQSFIDGLLSSSIDGANLFLLNPSGMLFGPNATLDVKGSFHVSTADYLRFEKGVKFYVNPAENPLLSVVNPVAFGFLSENPASISTQAALEVPEGETLSLFAGDIQIKGSGIQDVAELGAPGGRINIASVASPGVASPGEVIPNTPGETPDLLVVSFQELGTITISQNAYIEAGGAGGGTVFIRGGRLLVDSSLIYASAKAPLVNGNPGAGIDIKVSEDVVLDNPLWTDMVIGTNVLYGVPDDSGGVRIAADRLEVKNGAQIQSIAFGASDLDPASIGNTGDIEVTTNSLLVCDGGKIRTGTGGYGDSGDIIVKTGSLEVLDGGILFSPAFGATGNGGDIDVTAESIVFSNAKYPGYLTGIQTYTSDPGTGKAGDVRVTADSFAMSAGTEISTPARGAGQGGNIDIIVTGDVSIQGTRDLDPWGYNIYTGMFASTFYYGSGDGGNVTLTADSLEMITEAGISASAAWWSSGNAGDVEIEVGHVEIMDASYINSSALYAWGGNAGKVDVMADSVFISGPESSPEPFGADFTGISTLSGEWGGQGGDVDVTTNSMTLTNRASITASSLGPNPSGNVEIDAGSLHILNGSNILASAFGSGDGGSAKVTADTLRISGVHPELYTDLIGKQSLSPSAIGSQTALGGGNAGDMWISAENLELLDGGRLGGETFGEGAGANIKVEADNVLISGVNADLLAFQIETGRPIESASSGILTSAYASALGDDVTGKGGRIQVAAKSFNVLNGGRIASETQTRGLGGNIELMADQVMLVDDGMISAKSTGAGDAGNIHVTATNTFNSDNSSVSTAGEQAKGGDITIISREMALVNGTLISAESSGAGDAGNIHITAPNIFYMMDSAVTTDAKQADGGNIKIDNEYMVYLINSEITASVGGGPETVGGNISIDPEYVILKNSKIIANAYEGMGGNISIVSDVFLADPASIVDASSALGISGTVDIRAPITNVSGSISRLPKDFKSAIELLREACEARVQGGRYSSFILGERDGLPLEPGGPLPSPLY